VYLCVTCSDERANTGSLKYDGVMTLKLYEFGLSGNCHKVRLMLSMLGIQYESHVVNGSAGEHKSADFLALNPFGQVPVLLDEQVALRDSQAILLYLALKHPAAKFYPTIIEEQCAVQSWLSIASSEVTRGPGLLRLHYRFGKTIDVASAQQTTLQLLQVLNATLATQSWLVGSSITIADLAIYPYLALAHEGQVDLTDYPAITNWLAAVEALPGFVTMPGIQLHHHKVTQ